jgi:hypothetical protein
MEENGVSALISVPIAWGAVRRGDPVSQGWYPALIIIIIEIIQIVLINIVLIVKKQRGRES